MQVPRFVRALEDLCPGGQLTRTGNPPATPRPNPRRRHGVPELSSGGTVSSYAAITSYTTTTGRRRDFHSGRLKHEGMTPQQLEFHIHDTGVMGRLHDVASALSSAACELQQADTPWKQACDFGETMVRHEKEVFFPMAALLPKYWSEGRLDKRNPRQRHRRTGAIPDLQPAPYPAPGDLVPTSPLYNRVFGPL